MSEFAVIDLETTGLFPGGSHRVIEIAVVHFDSRRGITGTWETLLNPGRDLGPVSVHGIRSADVLRAPTFEQVAPQLVSLLRDRVVVAHNASFERRFLDAEFDRLGIVLPIGDCMLCTMRLAATYLPGSGRALLDCCAAYDIELEDAHRASNDALATARLLQGYLEDGWDDGLWAEMAAKARRTAWPTLPEGNVEWIRRGNAHRAQPQFLQRIAEGMPPWSGPAEHSDYFALLDRCLIDRHLSEHEKDELVELANRLGVERAVAEQLHRAYFDALTHKAWEDGRLTDEESGRSAP